MDLIIICRGIADFVSLTACTVCVFKPTQTLILKSEPQAKKNKNYTNCNWELDKTGMQVKIISEVLWLTFTRFWRYTDGSDSQKI